MYRTLVVVVTALLMTACSTGSPPGTTSTVVPLGPNRAASPTQPAATPEPAVAQPPVEQLVYVSSGYRAPNDGHAQIMIVNADGTDPRNLTNHTGSHWEPTLSPDGRQIAFISTRDGYQELYVMDAVGSDMRRLTDNDWNEQEPAWSPASNQIAFACYPEREHGGQLDSQICVINADGSELRNLSEDGVHGYGPVWSPDGLRIAFTGWDEVDNNEIFVIDADGTNLEQVTDNPLGGGTEPVWSPDGSRIAFVGPGEPGPAIHLIDADGSNQHALPVSPARGGSMPAWSPDGQRIAFVSTKGDMQTVIVVANADGSQAREIAGAGAMGYTAYPAWSPDGKRIAFVMPGGALQVIDASGNDLRTVTEHAALGYEPSWRMGQLRTDEAQPTTPDTTPTPTIEPPTLAEVYSTAGASLRRPGTVFQMTTETRTDAGLYSSEGIVQDWVDANRNVVRTESTFISLQIEPAGTFESTSIIVDGGRYTRGDDGEFMTVTARACYGESEAVATVLGCPGWTEHSVTTVEWGSYDGNSALVLVTTGTSSGSDERSTFTTRLYLDPETFLPIAAETAGTLDYGQVVPLSTHTNHQHEFITQGAVPPDFFDPASIGYVAPDFVAQLEEASRGTPIYWLGEHFEPEGGLPAIVLGGVNIAAGDYGPGYVAILDYMPVDDPYGASLVSMQIWPRATWEGGPGQSFQAHWEMQMCSRQQEIALEDGTARIYMRYNPGETMLTPDATPVPEGVCDDQMFNEFIAIVTRGDSVLQIYAAGSSSALTGHVESPYDTHAGMEAIIQALHPGPSTE